MRKVYTTFWLFALNMKLKHFVIQITGSQINAAKRLQFNLDVVPIKEVESMKNLPEVVLPLFWVEERAPFHERNNHILLQHQLLL